MPSGTTSLRQGQRVEFGVAEGRRGAQALQVRLLEPPPTVAAAKKDRKKPDEMVLIVEDLIKLLDHASETYRRGKQPDTKEAKRIAGWVGTRPLTAETVKNFEQSVPEWD